MIPYTEPPVPVPAVKPAGELVPVLTGTERQTPTVYDPKAMQQAFKLYLNTPLKMTDIAIDVGVPVDTVRAWVKDGKWREQKDLATKELLAAELDEYRKFIAANRLPTVQRHIRISQQLDEAVEAVLKDVKLGQEDSGSGLVAHIKALRDVAGTLKTLAEAFSSSATVGGRAVGVSDRTLDPLLEEETKNKSGKQALVVINCAPPRAAIDVTPEGSSTLLDIGETLPPQIPGSLEEP